MFYFISNSFSFHILSTVWMLISFLPTNLQPLFHHISNTLVSLLISLRLSYHRVYKPLVLDNITHFSPTHLLCSNAPSAIA
ncbi:hypothetical protein B0H14DRAFT_1129763 [Mycena olivaceomarginata]|nr:hypothetical protein B0H14DRAFT_1129763 [Mycena olivaceomarginata]